MSSDSTSTTKSGRFSTSSLMRASTFRPHHAYLETVVAQGGAQIVLNSDGLRLHQLAMGQQHPLLLTA